MESLNRWPWFASTPETDCQPWQTIGPDYPRFSPDQFQDVLNIVPKHLQFSDGTIEEKQAQFGLGLIHAQFAYVLRESPLMYGTQIPSGRVSAYAPLECQKPKPLKLALRKLLKLWQLMTNRFGT